MNSSLGTMQCNLLPLTWHISKSKDPDESWKILTTLGAPHAVTPLEMKLWNHDGTWKTKGWSCSMIAACSWGHQFTTDDSFLLFHRWPPTSNPTSSYPSTTVVRQARSLMACTYWWIPFAKLFERYIIINVAKMRIAELLYPVILEPNCRTQRCLKTMFILSNRVQSTISFTPPEHF